MLDPLRRLSRKLWSGTATHRRHLVAEIIAASEQLQSESDENLRWRGIDLKWLARSGVELDELLIKSYSLMREACRRTLKMAHYPVQIEGALAIFPGRPRRDADR